MTNPIGLRNLESALKRDLAMLGYPHRDWVPPRNHGDREILDVLIVGAGQSGLSACFALMREKVNRILVVDEKKAGMEGPWRDFARMLTLRTPKYVTGPDLGIPNLTFQAWYEAQWGEEAWASLKLIPKELWADYLAWYRRFLALPVRNGVKVHSIDWSPETRAWSVTVAEAETGPDSRTGGAAVTASTSNLWARKVILATGIDGTGRWEVPPEVKALPKRFWAHTHEAIDFASLAGKRVGVLGAGASAFDNAATALEAGAEVSLFFRREKLVDVNPYRWAEFTGFLKHHADLDDAQKWKFIVQFLKMGQLPPADTLERARKHPGFSLHPGSRWIGVEVEGDRARVTTPKGVFDFDFLIIGTGFVTDLGLRPELAPVQDKIALWSDRFTPPDAWRFEGLGRHPYLGGGGQFIPKKEGSDPWVSSLFCYTYAGLPSLGFAGAFISGLKYSLPKLVDEVTRQLYRDDAEAFFASLEAYDVKEF